MAGVLKAITVLIALSLASENGGYYTCSLDSNGYCIFTKSSTAPSSWGSNLSLTVDRDAGSDNNRRLVDSSGNELGPSPKPWTVGDRETASSSERTGANWNWVLVFEMIVPLRNKMMFSPGELDSSEWSKYSKWADDCKIKTKDETAEHGTAYSTKHVYEILRDPAGNDHFNGQASNGDVHNQVLQWIEEASIDMACLVTDIDMDRCDTIRNSVGIQSGEYSDCWLDAYEGIYGAKPSTDTALVEVEDFGFLLAVLGASFFF